MITARNLTFSYVGTRPVVQQLHASFQPGSTTALVGRSGSGKSTLLYLLGLLLSARSGSLIVDGVETVGLADWQRAEIRASTMGFVFQDALLDPSRSILDNVLEGALYSRDPARNAGRARQLLEEFEVEVDPARRPGQISGGQAQRVALCRAFIKDPRVVLADEPTGNLDDATAQLVMAALLRRAAGGAVVVVATHDAARARQCDSVLEVGDAASA